MHSDRTRISISLGLAALSLATAFIISFLKLPLYLDSFGIVAASIILGTRYGVLTALIIVLAGTFIVNPYLLAYIFTSIMIALSSSFLYFRGMFNNIVRTVFSGVILGLISAIASAPVTAYIFGGNTLSGSDLITTYLITTGQSLIESVFIAGFTSEPVDKIIVCVACYAAISSLPRTIIVNAGLRSIPSPVEKRDR